MIARLPILALALLVAAPALAAPDRLVLDADASEVSFTLDSTFHVVHGTLQLSRGELTFDLDAGTASGELVAGATTAETGNARRDKKMHGAVLESDRFPEFVFRAERVSGRLDADGTGSVELAGTLEIHGDSHPFVLPATVSVSGDRLEARSAFRIPYVEWGMKDPSFLLARAAKVVDVVVEARGRIQTQSRSTSAGSEP